MELPHVGVHCSTEECQQLDFLPIKCGVCQKLYCKNHYKASTSKDSHGHYCPNSSMNDNIVPECPLCSALIPLRKGENIDEVVGRHIDGQCRSKPAVSLKGKIFKNHCNFSRCKKRELMPIVCQQCGLNFCLTHRLEVDHQCNSSQGTKINVMNTPFQGLSRSAMAAIRRALSYDKQANANASSQSLPHDSWSTSQPAESSSSSTNIVSAQLGLSDEDALAMAVQASRVDNGPTSLENDQAKMEELDAQLAASLQAQEEQRIASSPRQHNQRANNNSDSSQDRNCSLQ